jgi:antitoxin (DNA-binding transcriptional repressor) of toxin-antitoxin stability system
MKHYHQITASEARERFAEVLSLVEAGETIEITRHGVVVARMSQAVQPGLSKVPDMDNSSLWKLSETRTPDKPVTEQLRKAARY